MSQASPSPPPLRVVDAPAAPPQSGLRERVQSLQLSGRARTGSRVNPRLVWTLSLVGVAVLVLVGWQLASSLSSAVNGGDGKTAPAPAGGPAASASAAGAPQRAAISGPIALEAKGNIVPARQILISPKVSGMITRSNIMEGVRVKKDDVLAVIEDIEYKADVARAEAVLRSAEQALEELQVGSRPEEIEQAKAELAEAEAQRVQLKAETERARELLAKKVLSQENYEQVESRYLAMARRADRLQWALRLMQIGPREERKQVAAAEVQRAKAELEKAKWRLDNCIIRAPSNGTILKKNAEEGNLVNPIAMQGSFSLCEMADLSNLEVEVPVQERDVWKIRDVKNCKIRAEAFPDRVYEGSISRLMPIADRSKASITVRVKVEVPADEEGIYLKPEMGALVTFLRDEKK